jgi:uncharacterized protein
MGTGVSELEAKRLAAMVQLMAPGTGLSGKINAWRFRRAARNQAMALVPLLSADPATSTGQAIDARPELLSFVRAPYLCAGWAPEERLNRLTTHLATLDHFPPLNFPLTNSINLMSLPMVGETYHVVIDKPMWFHREGVLTINLFDGDWRLFSLVFALEPVDSGLRALIGGIQGRNFDDALDRYRDLTKAANGLRPRDLLIELFRLVGTQLGVTEILAIADKGRQNRHPYFGKEVMRTLPLDYDTIWQDRGGRPEGEWFYRLPLTGERRNDADITAKKRSMYRQRYAMLNEIEEALKTGWTAMKSVTRPDAR